MISLEEAAALLREHDDILLIAHVFPDGDTLGSCFALCHALQATGKRARVSCCHPIPEMYDYMREGLDEADFEEKYLVTVDVADLTLMGVDETSYGHMIDLCIDHHARNRVEVEQKYVRASAAACSEIIFDLIGLLNVKITPVIAACLYTGISTDTGCFRYSNVTPNTHAVAAELMKQEYDFAYLNRILFEERSPARIALEAEMFRNLHYYCNNHCAVCVITRQMLQQTGAQESDLDGITGLPRTIRGVQIGICIRECNEDQLKVSVRTNEPYDAAAICSKFGGGGHVRAGGCTIHGKELREVEQEFVRIARRLLESEN